MRGTRFLALGSVPEQVREVPGARKTKQGHTMFPWHAYAQVSPHLTRNTVKRLDNDMIPTMLEDIEDPINNHPVGSAELREKATPAQREDLARALKLRGGLADWPCGSGKTVLGLSFATAFLPYKAVIVVPSTTTSQWLREAKRWLDTQRVRVGVVLHCEPRVRRRVTRTWMMDEPSRSKLRKWGAPEWLRFKNQWSEADLSADERGWLVKAKVPVEKTETWVLLGDLDEVLGEHSTRDDAEEAVKGWQPGDYDVIIIGWGLMSRPEVVEALIRWNPAVLVVDEAHRAKDPKRWTARKVRGEDGEDTVQYERKGNTSSNLQVLSHHVAACLLLTATPQAERPRDWWGILDLYDPFGWGSFYEFSKRYCNGHQGEYAWDSSGLSNVEELRARLKLMRFYRTKAETHKGLPSLRREYVVLDLKQAGKVDFTALGAEMRGSNGGGSPTAMSLAVACEQKIPWVLDRIKQDLRENLKVMVFVTLRASAHRIHAELSGAMPKHLILCGEGSSDTVERRTMVEQLTSSTAGGVLVGTIGAFGESIDGLQHVDRAYMLTVPWTPHQIRQAEGRFERLGGTRSVLLTYVRMAGTIDERVWDLVGEKLAMDGEVRADTEATQLGVELRGETPEAEAADLAALAELLLDWEKRPGALED